MKYILILLCIILMSCSKTVEPQDPETISWEHVIQPDEYYYDDGLQSYVILIRDDRFQYGYDYSIWVKQTVSDIDIQSQIDSISIGYGIYQIISIADGILLFLVESDYTGWTLLIFKTKAN